jgi:hypothetical protein
MYKIVSTWGVELRGMRRENKERKRGEELKMAAN